MGPEKRPMKNYWHELERNESSKKKKSLDIFEGHTSTKTRLNTDTTSLFHSTCTPSITKENRTRTFITIYYSLESWSTLKGPKSLQPLKSKDYFKSKNLSQSFEHT